MTVPLFKGKGERTECTNYRGISIKCVWKNICEDPSKKSDLKSIKMVCKESSEQGEGCRSDLHPKAYR